MARRRKSGQQLDVASKQVQGIIDCRSTSSGCLPLAQLISKLPTKKPAKPHRDSSRHVTAPDQSLNRVSSQRGRSDNDIVHFANNSLPQEATQIQTSGQLIDSNALAESFRTNYTEGIGAINDILVAIVTHRVLHSGSEITNNRRATTTDGRSIECSDRQVQLSKVDV